MKKIIIAALCALALPVCAVSADVLQYSAEFENGVYIISGKAENGDKNVSFEVIDGEYSFDELNPSNYRQISVWESQIDFAGGDVNFNVKIPLGNESKRYRIKINGQDFTESEEIVFDNVNSDDFKNTVSQLKENLTSYESFNTFIKTDKNAFLLGCDKLFSGADEEAAMKIMYESVKTEDIKDRDDTIRIWAQSNLASLINDKTDINDYSEFMQTMGETVKKWYDNAASQNDAVEKFSVLLKMNTYGKAKDIDSAVKKALVLTTVKYPNGVSNIGGILKDFSDLTGVIKSGEIEKYTKIAGVDYTDFDKFLKDFNEIKINTSINTTTGGGGNNSGSYPVSSTVSASKNEDKINMSFIDLDTVPWAYEAISTLTDKGIVSGKSKERFAPDDMILREEFAKLCVLLSGTENNEYTNNFSDVAQGAWYEKYVNIAFGQKICSGIGSGVFGVGYNISRQDMAVMLYNLLKSNNAELNDGGEAFDDDEQISDYAKEAVYALAGAGIINGVGDNRFAPHGNATRAESAKVIFGAMKLLQRGELNDK